MVVDFMKTNARLIIFSLSKNNNITASCLFGPSIHHGEDNMPLKNADADHTD
jgi:hypothetical protein